MAKFPIEFKEKNGKISGQWEEDFMEIGVMFHYITLNVFLLGKPGKVSFPIAGNFQDFRMFVVWIRNNDYNFDFP